MRYLQGVRYWTRQEYEIIETLTAKDVPGLLNEYVHYYNNERPAAALGYKSPVQYKTELGF